MGSAPPQFFFEHGVKRPISTCDVLLPGAVSNYAVYACLRELEMKTGQILLPDPDVHLALIERLVEAGCVDGFSGTRRLAVDGQPLSQTRDLLLKLRDIKC